MDDVGVTILNGNGPGSTPQEPLVLVAKMSDSERSALESKRRVDLRVLQSLIQRSNIVCSFNTLVPFFCNISTLGEVYYLLYADDYEVPSKVAIDPELPSLGRIRVDFVAPPFGPTSIKRCVSRVDENSEFAFADFFADTSCDTPLKEVHISIRRSPGLSPNEPMTIVQRSPIQNGKYGIKN